MKKHIRKKWLAVALASVLGLGNAAMADSLAMQGEAVVVEAKALSRKQAEKKLLKWLKKNGEYRKNLILVYDSTQDGKYMFRYFENMDDHIATVNWYYVDKKTGHITSMF
ncbi:MAG: hypothetical protein IJV04_05425 [Lachnospiraceae bacterium]|nr:hypothetical protein [Lachnospiraceae bacterium]